MNEIVVTFQENKREFKAAIVGSPMILGTGKTQEDAIFNLFMENLEFFEISNIVYAT